MRPRRWLGCLLLAALLLAVGCDSGRTGGGRTRAAGGRGSRGGAEQNGVERGSARGEPGEEPAAAPVGTWRATPEEGAPAGRDRHAAVVLGDRLVVWGGFTLEGQFQTYLNDGAVLDTAADAWIGLPREGAPSARMTPAATATAESLFVWGGRDGMNPVGDGAVWVGGRWRRTAPALRAPAAGATACWTGAEVIVWGGAGPDGAPSHAGARYDPGTDSWTTITDINAPTARSGHAAVWTGEQMIIWGGSGARGPLGTGAAFDPATDRWTSLPAEGAPAPRAGHTAVWTGTEMIVWGGAGGGAVLGDGAVYHPGEDAFRPVPAAGAPAARSGHTAVWSGERMIVWGGGDGRSVFASGGVYDPIAEAWIPTSAEGAPSARRDHGAAWTGSAMVVWGGVGAEPTDHPTTGGLFTP